MLDNQRVDKETSCRIFLDYRDGFFNAYYYYIEDSDGFTYKIEKDKVAIHLKEGFEIPKKYKKVEDLSELF